MRRIEIAVGTTLFIDSVLYLALLPFLPYYTEKFGLTKTEAGLVLAVLPVSLMLSSLPTGWLSGRIGARRVVIAGNVLFTVATLAFAFAPSIAVFAVARALQGVANGACWGAAVSWLTANAPVEARGERVGRAMGMVSAGSIGGPAIAAAGGIVSPEFTFAAIAALGLAATVLAIAAPPGRAEASESRLGPDAWRAIRNPLVVAGLAVATMDAASVATINLLGPIQLGEDGLSETAIGVPILLGSAVGWWLATPAGRLSDRRGPILVALVPGLGMAGSCAVLAIAPATPVILVAMFAVGPLFAFQAAAVYPLCTAGADQIGVPHGVVNGLMNLAWAGGLMVGQASAGAAADAFGDGAAYAGASAAILVLLAITLRAGRRGGLALAA